MCPGVSAGVQCRQCQPVVVSKPDCIDVCLFAFLMQQIAFVCLHVAASLVCKMDILARHTLTEYRLYTPCVVCI